MLLLFAKKMPTNSGGHEGIDIPNAALFPRRSFAYSLGIYPKNLYWSSLAYAIVELTTIFRMNL